MQFNNPSEYYFYLGLKSSDKYFDSELDLVIEDINLFKGIHYTSCLDSIHDGFTIGHMLDADVDTYLNIILGDH